MSQTMTRSTSFPAAAWLLLAALLFMYVPTFIDVARTFWQNERGTAGPLILAICAWLVWGKRDAQY